jgi:uncharacterized membrane protein
MKENILITNDATVLGLLFVCLSFVFYTSQLKTGVFKKFYQYVPSLLLCYFLPGLLNSFGIIDGESSRLYFVSSRYLLPSCLVLLTLSVDLSELVKLGPKMLAVFFAGTVGVVLGGPLALMIVKSFMPDVFAGLELDEVWRGMTTVAGSWIGGGANQASMKEVFSVSDKIFSMMVVVDILVANVWLAVLLFLASKREKVNSFLSADSSSVDKIISNVEKLSSTNAKIPSFNDLIYILSVGFIVTGLSHFLADGIAPFIQQHAPSLSKFSLTSKFFWLIVISTTFGVALSFTKFRRLESAGASKIGNVFLYILIASIGMHMNVFEIFHNPGIFLVGLIWISIHALIIFIVGKLVKAPLFFIAVGSQANIGGAASAPLVAGFFHSSLAPVGVLLAVLGYVVGTYGAWLCGILMQMVIGS